MGSGSRERGYKWGGAQVCVGRHGVAAGGRSRSMPAEAGGPESRPADRDSPHRKPLALDLEEHVLVDLGRRVLAGEARVAEVLEGGIAFTHREVHVVHGL